LQEAVPALAWVNWQITRVDEGYAETILPLNRESTNQHGTHQAALIALAADYTGGTALSSIVRGIPIVGVHPQRDNCGAALWLASIEIKYQNPSSGDLKLTSRVHADLWPRIRRRYADGQTVIQPLEITFESNGMVVASGTCVYMMKQAARLKPSSLGVKPNPLYIHSAKASARLIAGMRARETDSEAPIVLDPYAANVADAHGKLLADRFASLVPSMQRTVAARTRNLDELTSKMVSEGVRQFVFIGVGLDCRMYRLFPNDQSCGAYNLDFPEVLEERRRALSHITNLPPVRFADIPFNFELERIEDALVSRTSLSFRSDAPALFILEGISMYQSADGLARLLGQLRPLMRHLDSRLWIDVVSEDAIARRSLNQESSTFMEAMERLGSPFIFGIDQPVSYFENAGFKVHSLVNSAEYADSRTPDGIFRHYSFAHLGANA